MWNVRGRVRGVSLYLKSHRHPWTDCGARRRVNYFCLDALDLIEADLVAPAVVELRRALRGVVRHRRALSSVPPFLNISRDRSSGPAVRLSVEHVGTAAPTKPCRAERIAVRAWPPARRTPVPPARAQQSGRAPSEVCPTPPGRSPPHRHRDSASDRRS